MIRIDMSEYMEKHSVARLIGAPPGYVGYDEGGQLTEAVRRKPYSVILFDEIEKAHNDIFNVLLQILDDGRLTDGKGRTVDFKNTVLIMTSNIGSQEILDFQAGKGEDFSKIKEKVLDLLKYHFKPEFLNRVDEIIVFEPLGPHHMEKISELLLKRFAQRIMDSIGLELTWSEKTIKYLAEKGYDPTFGARPVKRLIQQSIETPLSRRVIQGIKPGEKINLDEFIAE